MKVLIIDDSTYIRNLIRSILEQNGFEVTGEASTGEEALDKIAALQPGVITLDNILPDMTGIDVLKACTLSENTHVIMISSIGQESARQSAFDHGVAHYLTKPIDSKRLLDIMHTLPNK